MYRTVSLSLAHFREITHTPHFLPTESVCVCVPIIIVLTQDEGVTSLLVHTKLFLMFQLMLTVVFYPLSLQPCITAQDLSWHQEHFVCSRCNTDLSQGGYTVHNSRDTVCVHVCMCVYVSKPLSLPPSPPLSLSLPFPLSLPISLPLPPSPPLPLPPSLPLSLSCEGFNMEAGQLFCGGCYGESYGATCGGCGSKIGGDQLWVEALDQQWHSHCFTCTVSE